MCAAGFRPPARPALGSRSRVATRPRLSFVAPAKKPRRASGLWQPAGPSAGKRCCSRDSVRRCPVAKPRRPSGKQRQTFRFSQRRALNARSADVKTAHQFLSRFHGQVRTHSAEQFFAPLRVHGCKVAHKLVACFPFGVFAPANANGKKRGNDPDRDVRRRHQNNKGAKGNIYKQPIIHLPYVSKTACRNRQEAITGRRKVAALAPTTISSHLALRGGFSALSQPEGSQLIFVIRLYWRLCFPL